MTASSLRHPAPLLGLLLLAAPAAAAERGTWWEMTSEMEMVGMPFAMPPTTVKVCQPDGDWQKPPQDKQEGNCQVKDLKRSGETMRWKMVCTGKEAMEGDGELTRSGDTFSGRTRIKSAHGDMTVKMRGKKLGGACDPEEQKRAAEAQGERIKGQIKVAEGQRAAAVAKACDDAIENMQASAVAGQMPSCQDPAKRQAFCARVRTEDGLVKLMNQAEAERVTKGMMPGPVAAAKACRLDLGEVKRSLCPGAVQREKFTFLAVNCPAEAKVLARRECAGRDYTALAGSKYRDFCSRMKGEAMEGPAEPKAAPEEQKKDPKDGAVDQGKKLLKGVFGF